MNVLEEAKRLHGLGFGILWLKPNSKAPVRSKWTTGERESWVELEKTYKKGFNVGVRLGRVSKLEQGYLAVIDIDVKGEEKKFQEEALEKAKQEFPGIWDATTPIVQSGRGNGSCHVYVLTEKPVTPKKLAVSETKVRVKMPSVKVSEAAKKELSEEDINEGWRIRPAWEVAIMGEGQQVVLPPSVHPDTKKNYKWVTPFEDWLPFLRLGENKLKDKRTITNDWVPENVDLTFSELDPDTIELLVEGDSTDRSASLFTVAIRMVKLGWSDRQIMSVLTDTQYALGEVAFEHANTTSRQHAANWIFNYTIKKARREWDAAKQFEKEVEKSSLSDEGALAQTIELQASDDWQSQLDRYEQGYNAGRPRPTLRNILTILANDVAPDIIKRDTFAIRDFYNHDAPWDGKAGEALSDEDALKIKEWLTCRHRMEPPTHIVHEAITLLAIKNGFDPVKTWLESLPEWDGVVRLDYWLTDHFHARGQREYLAQVFRKWLVAMVTRIYEPGAKFDWMPIFEGAQGIGKSSFGRLLVGDKYFLDWLPDLGDKDSALSLQGTWCVEMGELANLRKVEIETAKAFITRTIDNVRPPYGKRTVHIPRRCVFFGTTNADEYLKDDSGNRRFKPVQVGKLDFEKLLSEREQLFAEAIFLFKNSLEETLELTGEALKYEAEIHSIKTVTDEASAMLSDLEEWQNGENIGEKIGGKGIQLLRLFSVGGPLHQWQKTGRNIAFAAKAMKMFGYEKYRSNGKDLWKSKTPTPPHSPPHCLKLPKQGQKR